MKSVSFRAWIRSLVVALPLAFWSAGGGGATFTVNNLADNNDTAPGDGVCNVGDGTCSFRAAVQEANALAGTDRLELIAGTHVLSISNQFGLLKPSLNGQIEVVGAGIGVTTIFSDAQAQGGMLDVLSQPQMNTISNLTIDNRTGSTSFIYSGFGHNIVFDTGLVVEDVEFLANSTVPPLCCGAGQLITSSGSGRVELRRIQIQAQRVSSSGILINHGTTSEILIEDSILDGGNQHRIAVNKTFFPNTTGALTVRGSTFRNFGGPAGSFGAADAVIYMRTFSFPGQVTIETSTFESSYQAMTIVNHGFTAQVAISDTLFNNMSSTAVRAQGPAIVAVDNSTVSGGAFGVVTNAPAAGTGIVAMTVKNSTLTGATTNVALTAGQGTVTVQNSILANAGTSECSGTLTSAGHNLIEGTCTLEGDTTGNITGQDPMLDTLADNGGPTLTHALLTGSPAIDAGENGNCLSTDQRGFSRPTDGDNDMIATCDMGAFEKDAILVSNPPDAMDDDFSVDEDTSSLNMDVLANDTDGDGTIDPGTVNTDCGSCSEPANGSVTIQGDGSITYVPPADFFGQDTFVYEVCDDQAACDSATVTITVDPVNDAPSFVGGPDQHFPGGTSGLQTINNWVAGFDPGPNEGSQSVLDYEVIVQEDTSNVLNSVDVQNDGTLQLDLTGTPGTARINVRVFDDGGVGNGGLDVSGVEVLYVSVDTLVDIELTANQCGNLTGPEFLHVIRFEATNNGPDIATGVVLEYPLPTEYMLTASAPAGCIEMAGTVACEYPALDPGESSEIAMIVLVDTVAMEVEVTSTGTATPLQDDSNLANNVGSLVTTVSPTLVFVTSFEGCPQTPE